MFVNADLAWVWETISVPLLVGKGLYSLVDFDCRSLSGRTKHSDGYPQPSCVYLELSRGYPQPSSEYSPTAPPENGVSAIAK